MLFNFFDYCEGFMNTPTTGQSSPIDTAIQQTNVDSDTIVDSAASDNKPFQPSADGSDNFIPLEQADDSVNYDLDKTLNELAVDKNFGNPVPQNEWKGDEIGGYFKKGGVIGLENFEIDDLDTFERFLYDDMKSRNVNMTKPEILQILINSVEGDFSQLSPKLAKVAKGKNGKFATGGGLRQTGTTDKAHDKLVKAKRIGYRYSAKLAKKLGVGSNAKPTAAHIEKYLGKGIYFENRKNRSDKSRMKKFGDGGEA